MTGGPLDRLHVPHLDYALYKRVQDFIHAGYANQRRILARELAAQRARRPSGRVLELACGGGSLAEAFSPAEYTGVDSSPQRVAAARRDHPAHRFERLDVSQPAFDELARAADFVFCHGLLHHLDDGACRALAARIASLAPRPGVFVAIEPLLPRPWLNPAGYLIAKLDEGHFIRPGPAYRAFFAEPALEVERFSLLPRLPLSMEAYVVRYP